MADADENGLQPVKAVTGRPNDIPIDDPQPAPLGGNSTFADRAKANKTSTKQVSTDEAEDKAVTSAATKSRAKKK